MHKAFPLFAALAICPLAVGQLRFYSPAPFAHHDGITSTGYPIGYPSYTKMTYQQVHGQLPARSQPITRIAFRPRATSVSHAAYTVNLTLTFGLGGPDPDTATATFLTNLGPNPVTVLSQANVNIPAFTQAGIAPAPYHYAFPFTQPFVYDGKGVLCWEMRVHNHTYTGTTLNFDLYSTQTAITVKSGGAGCTASGQSAPATMSGTYSSGVINVSCANLSSMPVLLLLGLSSTDFGPIPLPLDLTPLGAPCALRTDILLALPGTVTAGTATWPIPVPATAPDGTAVFMQTMLIDPQANKLGWVFSNGLAAIWPYAKRPVIRNWKTADDQATSGSLQQTYGLYMEMGL